MRILGAARMSYPQIEWIRDGRCVLDGIAYSLATIATFTRVEEPNPRARRHGYGKPKTRRTLQDIELHVTCTRCSERWSIFLLPSHVRDIYGVVPSRPSAAKLYTSVERAREPFVEAMRHPCMPSTMPPIPRSVWSKVDQTAPTEEEKYEALAMGLADWLARGF